MKVVEDVVNDNYVSVRITFSNRFHEAYQGGLFCHSTMRILVDQYIHIEHFVWTKPVTILFFFVWDHFSTFW